MSTDLYRGMYVGVLEFEHEGEHIAECWRKAEIYDIYPHSITVRLMDGPSAGRWQALERHAENRLWKRL